MVRRLRDRWLRVGAKERLKGMSGLECGRGGGLAHVGRCRRLFFFVRLFLLSTSKTRWETQGRSRGRVLVGRERVLRLGGARGASTAFGERETSSGAQVGRRGQE